jgi:hypothetical protein
VHRASPDKDSPTRFARRRGERTIELDHGVTAPTGECQGNAQRG